MPGMSTGGSGPLTSKDCSFADRLKNLKASDLIRGDWKNPMEFVKNFSQQVGSDIGKSIKGAVPDGKSPWTGLTKWTTTFDPNTGQCITEMETEFASKNGKGACDDKSGQPVRNVAAGPMGPDGPGGPEDGSNKPDCDNGSHKADGDGQDGNLVRRVVATDGNEDANAADNAQQRMVVATEDPNKPPKAPEPEPVPPTT